MATQTKEPQGKILFKRTDIRTMRKDIKLLRELDARPTAIKENLTPTQAAVKPARIPVASSEPIARQATPQEKVFEQISEQDQAKMAQAKPYATEAEKQDIFALESQISQLKKEIASLSSEKEPSLNLEKNQVLISQTNQRKMLEGLTQQEALLEEKIKDMEAKEGQTNVPAERKSLESQRGALENQRQNVEKKRWATEQELSKLESQLASLDADFKGSNEQENALKEKIAGINASLRQIYTGIIDRQNAKNRELKTRPAVPTPKPKPIAQSTNPIQEKAYVKDMPVVVKEKIAESAAKENEQRRRFMEDIEAWANSNKN